MQLKRKYFHFQYPLIEPKHTRNGALLHGFASIQSRRDDELKMVESTSRHKMIPPQCTWPHTTQTYVLLILLIIQAIVCLNDAEIYPVPIKSLLKPIQTVLLRLFRSQHSLQMFFLCTLLVHTLEALYALSLIRRALRGRFGTIRTIL